jgi:hypothetical protein
MRLAQLSGSPCDWGRRERRLTHLAPPWSIDDTVIDTHHQLIDSTAPDLCT